MPLFGIEIGNDLADIELDALSRKRGQQRLQWQRRRLIRQVEVIDIHCCPPHYFRRLKPDHRLTVRLLSVISGRYAPYIPKMVYCVTLAQAIKRACRFHSSVPADRRQAALFDAVLLQHEPHRACALLHIDAVTSGMSAAESEADICKVRHRSLKLLREVAAPLSKDLRPVLRRYNDRSFALRIKRYLV